MEWNNFKRPSVTQLKDITYLKVKNSNIKTLPSWLNECTNLKKIKIRNCGLERILSDTFPESVKSIDLVDNKLTSIPQLPSGVIKLNISRNYIDDLNEILPNGLQILIWSCNDVKALPLLLPESLKELTCSFNHIEKIDTELPESLRYFNFANNDIYTITDELDNFMTRDNVKFEYYINPIQREVREAYIK